MNVLIAGGAGFIGSHLTDAFLARGDRVTVLDNLLTGSLANLEHVADAAGYRFLQADVAEPLPVEERFDLVCHLASPASPVGYGEHPVATMRANAVGAWNLLERVRQSGGRFLFASTSEVYGDPLEHPQSEEYWGNVNPLGPRACYDESKRYAEAMTKTYGEEYGVDWRIVRIFNTYGPRNAVEDGRIIPNFVTQAIEGRPLTVFGQGHQTRSYCYVDDLVRGLVQLATQDSARHQVINLGNPEEVSALAMAQMIVRLADSTSPIVHLPDRPEEIARRRPDISRARSVLGWEPQVTVEDGLTRTIASFRPRLAATLG